MCDQEFQIYESPLEDRFTLEVSEPMQLLRSFAADINRPALASFETINQISRSDLLPKSAVWLVIKSYYASYFAAHAIMRMLGTSFTQLTRQEIDAVNKIAKLLGIDTKLVNKGYFLCHFDVGSKKLTCLREAKGTSGNHEMFWFVFVKQMKKLSEDLLNSKIGSFADNQFASAKLTDLCDSLCRVPCSKGNWLSYIRNEVNYKQRMGVWFPYEETKSYYNSLFSAGGSWEADAGSIGLLPEDDHSLRAFQQTCNFIISLCRELVIDMESRCSVGKSFHAFGSIRLMNHLKQRRDQA